LYSQVYFVDDKDDPDWKTVVEVESRSHRVYEGASGAHANGEADMDDGIEMELEPAPAAPPPAAPPPVGEAIPLEHVQAVDADMEDPNDRGHMNDNEYPDIDDDEEADEVH
jgi:hypothetical protein